MGANCSGGSCSTKFDGMSASFKRALWIVIAINGGMFLVEMMAGFKGQSMALKADALDFLGDSVTYAISLWAIGQALAVRAKVAWLKGVSLGLMAVLVLGATLYRVFVQVTPDETIMGSIAIMALVANMVSVLVLMKYRDGDANVRSVWLCSRNDAIGNLAVIGAASLVYYTRSPWPDIAVALLMASLFLYSARQILTQAQEELKEAHE